MKLQERQKKLSMERIKVEAARSYRYSFKHDLAGITLTRIQADDTQQRKGKKTEKRAPAPDKNLEG
jgi:hypothetical protein